MQFGPSQIQRNWNFTFEFLGRYLYWSDWGDNPHIGRIGMDGTNRSVIVEDKITWPNGLTLDFVNDRIYWADAREDYIAFASLDGTSRHTSNTHLNCNFSP